MKSALTIGLVMWVAMCWAMSSPVEAACVTVTEPDLEGFIGERCTDGDTSLCEGSNATTCSIGRWLHDDGGVFTGRSDTSQVIVNGITFDRMLRSGFLRTANFVGTLGSFSERAHGAGPNSFITTEERTGTETLRSGSVFVGFQRVEVREEADTSGDSSLFSSTIMSRDGTLTDGEFSGSLSVVSRYRRNSAGTLLHNSVITIKDGSWIVTPSLRLEGTLKTEVIDGVITITDNRVEQGTELASETPWQTNASGTQVTDVGWNYSMGYQFVPQVDGKVTKLGGLFKGTKTIYLYDSSGSVLALTNVTGNNSWVYSTISAVGVKANQTYTVAVDLAGSGGSYRALAAGTLPNTFGNIQILQTVYGISGSWPTTGYPNYMFGQADIEFVPNN